MSGSAIAASEVSYLIDSNLLVYAAAEDAPHHLRARAWMEDCFSDTNRFVGLCWVSVYAFARLVSNRKVMGPAALPVVAAWSAAEQYVRQPLARMIEPGPSHPDIASRLIRTPGLAANDAPDVYMAALAIEHGLTLATHDHGFGRFAWLSWEDPVTPS